MQEDPNRGNMEEQRPQPRYGRAQAAPKLDPAKAEASAQPTSSRERLEGAGVSPRERESLIAAGADTRAVRLRIERFTRLLKMSQRLSSILEHDALLDAILDEVIPLANAQRGLLLLTLEGGGLEIARGRSAEGESVPNDLTKVSGTLARSCIAENRVQVYDDLANRPELREIQSIRLNDLYSAICLPLREKGVAFGVLYLDSSLPTMLHSGVELDLLEGFASHASICLINARLIRSIERSRAVLVRENENLRAEVQGGWRFAGMIGKTPVMQQVFDRLRLTKDLDIPVLLLGESGTGKELVARALHSEGHRANKPFVPVNCAAIPEQLVESEIFGHRKGSFTGATMDRPGLVEQAHEGTLFLDEVGDMPRSFQPKLLRFMDGGEYRPVGHSEVRHANVRIISATNLDLDALIAKDSFRSELLYRLEGVRMEVPSLRERRDDIPLLIDHYFGQLVATHPRQITGITDRAFQVMMNYSWPGNVRQLIRVLQGAAAFVPDGAWLDVAQLELRQPGISGLTEAQAALPSVEESLREALARAERLCLQTTLGRHDWNITRAARDLRISRQHLHNRIRVQELKRP